MTSFDKLRMNGVMKLRMSGIKRRTDPGNKKGGWRNAKRLP
jgi:hypothetical protein